MTISEISFETTRHEFEIISKIVDRAMVNLKTARKHDQFARQDLHMDLAATHANGNPLRLEALLAADDFNFTHDILGIRRHLNRNTGELEDGFTPRFSRREAEAV